MHALFTPSEWAVAFAITGVVALFLLAAVRPLSEDEMKKIIESWKK